MNETGERQPDPQDVHRADLMRAMEAFPERVARSYMEQQRLIDALFDTSKHLALLLNAEGGIMRASRFLASALGFDESELRGADWRQVLVAGDGLDAATGLMEAAAIHGTDSATLPFSTRHGTRLGLELVARTLSDGPTPYAFLLTGTLAADTSALGGCGSPVEEATARALASMGDAVLAVEPDSGMVVDCNREAAALYGLPVETIRRMHVASFLEPENDASGRGDPDRPDGDLGIQTGRGFLSVERKLRRSSGTSFHASILAVPVMGSRGSLDRMLYVIKDVSGAREADNERRYVVGRLKELGRTVAELGERLENEQGSPPEPDWSLTPRQKEIAGCVLAGMPNKQIAHALGLSESSVKVHVYSMYKKTGARSRVEFVKLLHDTGFHIS